MSTTPFGTSQKTRRSPPSLMRRSEAFAEVVRDTSGESGDTEVAADFERVFKIWGISFVTGMTVVAALAFVLLLAALIVLAAFALLTGVTISTLQSTTSADKLSIY